LASLGQTSPSQVVFNNTFDNTLRIINDLVEDPKASDEQLIEQVRHAVTLEQSRRSRSVLGLLLRTAIMLHTVFVNV
jgi:hypothetical protein